MKKILIFLVLITPALLFGKDVDRKVLDYDFDKKTYSTKSGKPFSGTFVIKDSQGQVVKRVTLKNGKQDGFDITYNNGKLSSKFNFKNGVREGEQFTYSLSDGKLYQIQEFKAGKANGITRRFDSNGKLDSETTYKDGKKNGLYKKYHANGKVKMEGNYLGFKKTGEWKWYSQSGKVTRTKKYK